MATLHLTEKETIEVTDFGIHDGGVLEVTTTDDRTLTFAPHAWVYVEGKPELPEVTQTTYTDNRLRGRR